MFSRDPKTAQIGREILPFEMGYLPDFFKRKAEVELNDTAKNRKVGLKQMKELMENDELFSGLSFDDDFLLQYLRCRKFNTERAFTKLKAFVKFRKNNRALFEDFHFEKIAITTRNKIVTFLPHRCQDGCAILLIKIANWIPDSFPVEEVRRMAVVLVLQALRDPMSQVNGFKVIFDFECNPLLHLKYVTPYNLYLIVHGALNCAPVRVKSVHFVNLSIISKIAWMILKVTVSTKVKERIHFHTTPEELLDYFPKAVLPFEYGGELTDYDMTDWLKDVMSEEKLATLGGGRYSAS